MNEYEQNEQKQFGRTFRDILYSIRYYLIAGGLIAFILYRFGLPTIPDEILIVIPAVILGLALGVIRGFRIRPPSLPPTFIIKPENATSARVFTVYDPSALILSRYDAIPLGTPYGATIRLADRVEVRGNELYVEPSTLHVLAITNPLEALAHIRSLSNLAEELDRAIARYVELYVSTRASARQLARRRVSELLSLEKQAEKSAKELLKKGLEVKNE